MFERFTDSARRAVVSAQEEARRLDHGHIGTEHLLLGLLGEGKGLAGTMLAGSGLTLEGVRADIEEMVGRGENSPGAHIHIPFTGRAKKVLELSLREALQLHHNYISTEHILLGLIQEGHGVGAKVLELHEIDLELMRGRLIEGAAARRERRPVGPPTVDPIPLPSQMSFMGRLERIQESLNRIERRLDTMGVPPADEGDDAPENRGTQEGGTSRPS
ncbi:Clp protease N-terminal domain-containing protein [Sphaerisporangium sp. NPDC004334]